MTVEIVYCSMRSQLNEINVIKHQILSLRTKSRVGEQKLVNRQLYSTINQFARLLFRFINVGRFHCRAFWLSVPKVLRLSINEFCGLWQKMLKNFSGNFGRNSRSLLGNILDSFTFPTHPASTSRVYCSSLCFSAFYTKAQ